MEAQDVVYHDGDMNVIRLTSDFKLMRYPYGLIKNFKARFFASGDMQIEGIYLFETYSPAVQWTTISFMLIIEVLLQLK